MYGSSLRLAETTQIVVAIGRNYADHAKELAMPFPRASLHLVAVAVHACPALTSDRTLLLLEANVVLHLSWRGTHRAAQVTINHHEGRPSAAWAGQS